MLRKILNIFLKVIFGFFLFYVVVGFIIIPLVLTWAIPSQGTKFLKHPVHLHSVEFNPFLLQLTMNGFEVLDDQNQVIVSFDKLFVDVSFLDLLKKIYHVENVELDGLKVNVELLPSNQVNLLELMPPGTIPSSGQGKYSSPTVKVANSTSITPASLPPVIIDSIALHQGQVHFTDTTIKPLFLTTLNDIEMTITNVTTIPASQVKIKFHANLDDKGKMFMETIIKPLEMPLEMETTFSLNDYALGVLTPYAGKYTGRELRNGKLDLKMDYRIGGNKLIASHKVLIQRFEFGNNVASKDALHLPFGLAVALLQDSQGKIKITLPVSGDMSNPKFQYTHLMFQVIRNFFLNLVTKPFSFLASTMGVSDNGTDELGYVRFVPGKTELTDKQKQRLLLLIKSLKEHPKLRLEIEGGYDPQADWKTMQANIFNRDYEALKKISTRSETKNYQLLYQRRFGIRALWALAKKYKAGVGNYDDSKLDPEIKRQLIENAPPDVEALKSLAQSRAQMVYDFLLKSNFDAKHLTIGHPQSTQISMGYVPTEFTLTVFENKG